MSMVKCRGGVGGYAQNVTHSEKKKALLPKKKPKKKKPEPSSFYLYLATEKMTTGISFETAEE